MSPEARERSFDDLARGLANGSISRGKALRLMGAALVGGVLASIPRVAVAATCSPSGCCECELADPETFQVVRKKCMLLSTTDCQGETGHLVNVCARRCRKFKERKYPNLLITQTSVSCPDPGAQFICRKSNTIGVLGTECGSESCTPPA